MDLSWIFAPFVFLFGIAIFAVHILIVVWGYKDARKKGRSDVYALGIALMLVFFPVLGIIVYLLIRNN
jgi:hypothetical protein